MNGGERLSRTTLARLRGAVNERSLRVIRTSNRWVENPMAVVTTRFCLVIWMPLNPGTVGYEPFSNQDCGQRATRKPSQSTFLACVALGLFGSRLEQLPG
jgi:hypothetical protein